VVVIHHLPGLDRRRARQMRSMTSWCSSATTATCGLMPAVGLRSAIYSNLPVVV